MTPSNCPWPPIGTAPVDEPNAVMMPASTRSLSCQSRLVTWKGIFERSPYAVIPSNSTNVPGVADQLFPSVIHSGSSEYAMCPAMGT
jgi:hypothetical protein